MAKKLNVRPLKDRVVLQRIEEEPKTAGGLYIPDTAKEKAQEGEVVAVGKGKVLDNGKIQEPELRVGDRVLFSKYSGTEIKIEGEEYLILREDDISAVIG